MKKALIVVVSGMCLFGCGNPPSQEAEALAPMKKEGGSALQGGVEGTKISTAPDPAPGTKDRG